MPNRPPREAAPGERDKADKESQQAGEHNERMLAEMADMSPSAWIWEEPIRERLAIAIIALLERHYAETKNPALVWHARQTALEFLPHLDSPALRWIDEYLAEVTAQLVALIEHPPPRDVNSCIAAALGFDATPGAGRGSAFSETRRLIRDITLATQVVHRLPSEDGKEWLAINHVAEKNRLSVSTVGNAFRSLKANINQASVNSGNKKT
jgi:hypothetical protein